MVLGICDEIRDRCAMVAGRAAHVGIDPAGLSELAQRLPISELGKAGDDPAHRRLGDDESTAAFVISLDAINFGSGWFPTLHKRPGMSGYHTIASSFREHFERAGPPTAQGLTDLVRADCCSIFGQPDDDSPAAELMELYASALNDLGAFLIERYEASFLALVEDAGSSAERLVGILGEMPFFHDVSEYYGTDVPFYKRAQICAHDLSIAFQGEGPGRFDDLAKLTIFADNLVPHVLRVDGVLRYDEDLASLIDREELVPPGTPAEIEIRACAVHAVELLREDLERRGTSTTSAQLDNLLWSRGGEPRYKEIPRHRTRTVCY